ncbi:MAG: hypothetical protein ACTTJF_05175 [Campylobacter sp.]|uniref:hypothetical protein n=1 Tax=Campylobacter sp. TaxID=205 RepID=UPI003FA0E5E4
MILFASLNLRNLSQGAVKFGEFGGGDLKNAGKFISRENRLNLKAEFKKERRRLKFNPRREKFITINLYAENSERKNQIYLESFSRYPSCVFSISCL